jgi:hypothetical protein
VVGNGGWSPDFTLLFSTHTRGPTLSDCHLFSSSCILVYFSYDGFIFPTWSSVCVVLFLSRSSTQKFVFEKCTLRWYPRALRFPLKLPLRRKMIGYHECLPLLQDRTATSKNDSFSAHFGNSRMELPYSHVRRVCNIHTRHPSLAPVGVWTGCVIGGHLIRLEQTTKSQQPRAWA